MSKFTDYPTKVLNGEIVANEYIKLACKRFFEFLKRDDMEFREDKVERVIKFIGNLKHFQGAMSGQHFIPTDWQIFIISNIYGFYWKDTDKRVTKNVYIEVGRKAGKTTLLVALSLYAMLADGEDGAEVDCIANSRQQARILYDAATGLVEGLDRKGKYVKVYRNSIKFKPNHSFLQVLSSDSKRLDGMNAFFLRGRVT